MALANNILAFDHRTPTGDLLQPEMQHLECDVKLHVIEPHVEYRKSCPWILVTSKGAHAHPIPFPQKTPPAVREELFRLLNTLPDDLADLTPRRFLRHPILKAYLRDRFPSQIMPALSDLHVSLANRSHLKAYIEQAKKDSYPCGTGWEGMSSLNSI